MIMGLCGTWDITLLPGLLAGGVVGMLLPRSVALNHRRGETGLAQVRLELSARILEQTRALLLETRSPPLDREAVLEKVRLNACENCGSRKVCTFREEMTHRRMEAARQLMKDQSLSLTEIAEKVGYQSYSGFWKAFHEKREA